MRCPKCEELLLPGSKRCGDCGWRAQKKAEPENIVDHKCAWSSGHIRCPAMGTLSSNTKGNGPYYCRWHYFNLGDFQHGLKVTEDMIKNGVPNKKDW